MTIGRHGRRLAAVASLLAACIAAAAPGEEALATLDAAVTRAKASLSQVVGAPADKIKTVSADSLVWRDTSMGCGSPTESHAQIDVEGFQVVLEFAGKRYDYRARKGGEIMLCQQGTAHE